jgi:hypothetical protein
MVPTFGGLANIDPSVKFLGSKINVRFVFHRELDVPVITKIAIGQLFLSPEIGLKASLESWMPL